MLILIFFLYTIPYKETFFRLVSDQAVSSFIKNITPSSNVEKKMLNTETIGVKGINTVDVTHDEADESITATISLTSEKY